MLILAGKSGSLDTPEQTCGACLQGHVGEEGDGNEECIRTFGTTKSVILCILSLRYYLLFISQFARELQSVQL